MFKKINLYKINQSKLGFLPTVFAFFVFVFLCFGSFWYFSPFNAGEIKVLAINKIIPENQSGKFFGYLKFYEEPVLEKSETISAINPEITVKSFDSRLIDGKIFYLSQNCVQISLQNCEFWSFDRTKNELVKLDSNIAKNIQNNCENANQNVNQIANLSSNSISNSDTKPESNLETEKLNEKSNHKNLKFAEFQEKDWFNFIVRSDNSDSYSLLQIDKINLQNYKIQIITQDNPDYVKYFR